MRAVTQTTTVSGLGDRLLLVEDDVRTANIMTRLLKSAGINVEAVGTVKGGLDALSRMPAVVILDLRLPDGSGVDVLEAIRSKKLQCKVAVVSASTDESTFNRVRAASPDAIFAKPLDFEDLLRWLCEAFPSSGEEAVAA